MAGFPKCISLFKGFVKNVLTLNRFMPLERRYKMIFRLRNQLSQRCKSHFMHIVATWIAWWLSNCAMAFSKVTASDKNETSIKKAVGLNYSKNYSNVNRQFFNIKMLSLFHGLNILSNDQDHQSLFDLQKACLEYFLDDVCHRWTTVAEFRSPMLIKYATSSNIVRTCMSKFVASNLRLYSWSCQPQVYNVRYRFTRQTKIIFGNELYLVRLWLVD